MEGNSGYPYLLTRSTNDCLFHILAQSEVQGCERLASHNVQAVAPSLNESDYLEDN
jgi:hypothetical protein